MADRTGQHLGNYRLVHLLGQGGFAEVYLGEHIHLGTEAAIKLLHTQLAGEETDAFRTEARTIARLVHPHIVRVFDFGIEGETPYLVMDYAPGGTVRKRHPRGVALPLPTILDYVKQVAEALQYAHDQHFIHRDIKPENLLVGRRQEVLLSDFGIALLAQTSRSQSMQDVTGTASYMAPEQFQGKPRQASDQYALAVMVYEWFTGACPFRGSFTEIASQHLFVPPPPLREQVPDLSPAVEQVVLTALAKDPHQRFASVRAFATAFEQASQMETSETLPASRSSLSRELATAPSESGIPTLLSSPSSQTLLPTGPATPLSSSLTAAEGADLPLTQLAAPTSLPKPVKASPPAGTLLLTYRGHANGLGVCALAWSPDGTRIASSGVLDVLICDVNTGNTLLTYENKRGLTSLVWSPDGKYIASGSLDKRVQVWDAASGQNIRTYRGHSAAVSAVAWSPDGKYIASVSTERVQVWDAASGQNIRTYRWHVGVNRVAWSPNGRYIAFAIDTQVQVWNAVDRGQVSTCSGHSAVMNAVAWSPDGRRIASASLDKTVQVWDADTGKNILTYRGHSDKVLDVAWSPDGNLIASAGGYLDLLNPSKTKRTGNEIVQIWDATTGNTVYTYYGHTGTVLAVAWSPDGKRIASCGWVGDNTVQVWQAP